MSDAETFTEDGGTTAERLVGRACFLRDRGEIKSPELMEQAARELQAPYIMSFADVTAKMNEIDSNWNAYGRSREEAVRLAYNAMLSLARANL